MKRMIILFTLTFLSFSLSAQDYLWSHRGGSFNAMGTFAKRNQVLEITSDMEGNTYMLAQSGSSQLQLAEIPLTGYADANDVTNNNQFNLVFASFTPEGENRWIKVIGGQYNTYGYSLKTDEVGHVYLAGRIYPSQLSADNTPVHFDTDTILPQGVEMNEHKKIMYLAQYDTDGTFNWLHMPEPDTVTLAGPFVYNSWPYKADVNPENGDVYWHCKLREGQFDWDGDNVITEESDYILQYNSAGEVTGRVKLDMQSAGANTVGTECLMYMERDHETGIFYIAGTQISTYEPLSIGGEVVNDRLFAAAFSPTGEVLWRIEGDNDEAINGVFANNTFYDMAIEDGYIYLTGTLASGSEFNGHVFDPFVTTACSPFVMKLDFDGNTEWGQISATAYNSYSRSLAIRGDEVAIAGQTGPISWPGANSTEALTTSNANAHISRFDKYSGNLIALDSISPVNGIIDIHEIYAPGDCNYYIGGAFNVQLILAQDTLWHEGVSEQTYFYSRYSFGTDLLFTYTGDVGPGSYTFSAESDAETITWDFGDGSPAQTGTSVSHTFAEEGEYEVCATASGDCESTYCLTVAYLTTGIPELNAELKVYPNPAVGQIRIEGLNQNATYSIYGYNGALVKQGQVYSRSAIDVSGLMKGMYVLVLRTADGEGRLKVVVENN